MKKVDLFEIHYSNVTGVYEAGQLVEGHVLLDLNQPMVVKGITIRFQGEASVGRNKRHIPGRNKHHLPRNKNQHRWNLNHHLLFRGATEIYFHHEDLLFGIWPQQGKYTQILPAGKHSFPFRYQLPDNLPSSFEDEFGHVRYLVTCSIDLPLWFYKRRCKFDREANRPLVIMGRLDLNRYPSAMEKVHATREIRPGLFCNYWKSGPVQAIISIDKGGYVPGEAVKIFADISNRSSRNVDQSFVNLLMYKTFHGRRRSFTTRSEVARVTRPAIPAHGRDVWFGVAFLIPSLPPSFLEGCKLIDIKYVLMLNVHPSGHCYNLEVPLDIIIGTVPFSPVMKAKSSTDLSPPTVPALPALRLQYLTPSLLGIEHTAPQDDRPTYKALAPYKENETGQNDNQDNDDSKGQIIERELNYTVKNYHDLRRSPKSKV